MKKIFGALLCAGALTACQGNDANVSGTLDVDADTLLVYSSGGGREFKVDTVQLNNKQFSVQLADTALNQVFVFAMKDGMTNRSEKVELLLLPGKKVQVNGDMNHYTLKGDAFYEACNDLRQQGAEWQLKVDSIQQHFMQLYQSGISPDSLTALSMQAQDEMEGYINNLQEAKKNYLKQHLDEDIAVYGITQLGEPEAMIEIYQQLGEKAKAGALAPLYEQIKDYCEGEIKRQKAAEAVQPGKPAPEFTLTDINGKPLSLASLRGKYVVLDFWGSWCGWCIKGMPEMKKYYKKYSKKMEIVGIDCNEPEDKWKEAVKKHELPWLHVIDNENVNVAAMYAVSGFPTKVIIDREGKIVKVVVGEDPQFYKDLDQLLKK